MTEQKKSQELVEQKQQLDSSLQDLQLLHHELFDNISDGAVTLKPMDNGKNFIISGLNKTAEKIENIERKKVIGKTFSEAFPKANELGLTDVFRRVLRTGKNESFPVLIKDKETIKHSHQNKIIKISQEKLLVLYNEVKEYERSKKALEESEERLKLALESTKIGLWDHNLKTGEVYRSKEWAEMLGYSKKEIDNKCEVWKDLIHPDDRNEVNQIALAHETSETDTFQVEHRLKTKKGHYKWILNWGKIIEKDAEGNPVRAVGTHLDIDKRKKTEKKLAELNATKDRLFSIIGHDLKNPLSDILGFSSLITKNYSDYSPEKVRTFVEYIEQAATRMHDMLENLLRWSRLQREETSFKPEKINLTQLITKNIHQFQIKADSKEISLCCPEKNTVYAYADKNMIETVIRNLLSNALKYTDKGGEVTIQTAIKNNKITVSVQDTGIGIRVTDKTNLFQPEKQNSTNGTLGEKGTGLGLILCKEIIDIHNEDIWVESEPGKGSTFRFTLTKANG